MLPILLVLPPYGFIWLDLYNIVDILLFEQHYSALYWARVQLTYHPTKITQNDPIKAKPNGNSSQIMVLF